jgi:soluble lytic murein transglycosylase-like protein
MTLNKIVCLVASILVACSVGFASAANKVEVYSSPQPNVERNPLVIQCISRSAVHFGINPLLVQAVINVEGGGTSANKNSNGTLDYGTMQINDVKFPEVKQRFPTVTKQELTHDRCINVAVGTWVLYDHAANSGSVWKAIAWYNSKTPGVGDAYRNKVLREYQKLIKSPDAILTYKPALVAYLRLSEQGKAITFQNFVVKR